jgi:hypothetical protein
LIDLLRREAGKHVIAALRDDNEDYMIRAKIREQELEIGLSPSQRCNEGTVPMTREAVPNELIVGPDWLEVLVYPAFPANSDGFIVSAFHMENWHGARVPNHESIGGFITIIAKERGHPDPQSNTIRLGIATIHTIGGASEDLEGRASCGPEPGHSRPNKL